MKNLVYYPNKQIKHSWVENYFRRAVKELVNEQAENEEWYLKAMLGLEDRNYFQDVVKERIYWGRSVNDYLYRFWTEEDLRLALAGCLHREDPNRCAVHGQVHLKRDARKREYIKGYFPDIYFVIKKSKERDSEKKERNVESGAIEIKYYEMGLKPANVKASIRADLGKLVRYSHYGLRPRTNAGFFLCFDESGNAIDVLKEFFRQRRFKKKRLAYAVITPNYIKENRPYPREYGNLDFEKRKLKFIMDIVWSRLIEEWPSVYGRKRGVKSGYDSFYIDLYARPTRNRWIWKGWIALLFKEYSPHRPQRYSILIKVKNESHVGDAKVVMWDDNKGRYIVHPNPKKVTRIRENYEREYYCFGSNRLIDLMKMKEVAHEIVKKVRKIQRRIDMD